MTRVGFVGLAGAAPLLAKDVGLLADLVTPTRSPLLDAAGAALARMEETR